MLLTLDGALEERHKGLRVGGWDELEDSRVTPDQQLRITIGW